MVPLWAPVASPSPPCPSRTNLPRTSSRTTSSQVTLSRSRFQRVASEWIQGKLYRASLEPSPRWNRQSYLPSATARNCTRPQPAQPRQSWTAQSRGIIILGVLYLSKNQNGFFITEYRALIRLWTRASGWFLARWTTGLSPQSSFLIAAKFVHCGVQRQRNPQSQANDRQTRVLSAMEHRWGCS